MLKQTGALECQYKKKYGMLTSLSEQNFADCLKKVKVALIILSHFRK
jgi:hypothetical protein